MLCASLGIQISVPSVKASPRSGVPPCAALGVPSTAGHSCIALLLPAVTTAQGQPQRSPAGSPSLSRWLQARSELFVTFSQTRERQGRAAVLGRGRTTRGFGEARGERAGSVWGFHLGRTCCGLQGARPHLSCGTVAAARINPCPCPPQLQKAAAAAAAAGCDSLGTLGQGWALQSSSCTGISECSSSRELREPKPSKRCPWGIRGLSAGGDSNTARADLPGPAHSSRAWGSRG